MRHILALIFAFGVVACTGNGTDGTVDTDQVNVTDPDVNGTATIDINTFAAGDSTDCMVNVDGEFAGYSWETIEVSAGKHVITVGTMNSQTNDGLPTHMEDNLPWVSPEFEVDLANGEHLDHDVDQNRYFFGTFSCYQFVCEHDSNAPDGIGEICDDADTYDPQFIDILDGEVVSPDIGFYNFHNGGINVSGDSLVIMDLSYDHHSSELSNDSTSFLVRGVSDRNLIYEFGCYRL
jgi:hypothetical protein